MVSSLISSLIVISIIFWLYFAPAAIGFARHVPNRWSIGVVNLFLGWTLIGWVVALALAVRDKPQAEEMAALAAAPEGATVGD